MSAGSRADVRCPTLAELPPPPPGRSGWPWTAASAPLPAAMPDGAPWPRISIVTPSFNQAEFLEETLRSVLLQGYPDLEYVVMDGGSADGSAALLERYSPWLTHWQSAKDGGQADAINRGLRRATGGIVAWVNSDDYYLPNAFATVAVRAAEAADGPFWLVSSVLFLDQETGGTRRVDQQRFDGAAELIPFDRFVQAAGAFWDRSFLASAGELRTDLHYGFDKEYWLRLLAAGHRFRVEAEPTAVYRFHDSSKSVSARLAFRYEWALVGLQYAALAGLDRAAVRGLRRELAYNAARIAQDSGLPARRRRAVLLESARRAPASLLRRDWLGGLASLVRAPR